MRSASKSKPESKSAKSQTFFAKDTKQESAFFKKDTIQRQEVPFFKGNKGDQSKGETNLPAQLKKGVEQLSSQSMSDVKVHYNSSKPADIQAHAFAKGADIHLAPGQEKHLPHEAWHVAQQKQGRVKPTTQLKGEKINDDSSLEKEADEMGAKATRIQTTGFKANDNPLASSRPVQRVIQRAGFDDPEWEKVDSVKVVSGSSNGGVVIVTFANEEVFVLKGADAFSPGREVLAGNLAPLANMPVPKIRQASSQEHQRIDENPKLKGNISHLSPPLVVMENVKGYDLGKIAENNRVFKHADLLKIAEQLGRWLAFDMLISETDRFHELGNDKFNLNAGNLMIASDSNEISGVDQTASFLSSTTMEDDGSKTFDQKKRAVFEKIKAIDQELAITISRDIVKRLVPDPSMLVQLPTGFGARFGKHLLNAAKAHFEVLKGIDPEEVDKIAATNLFKEHPGFQESVLAIKKNIAFLNQ